MLQQPPTPSARASCTTRRMVRITGCSACVLLPRTATHCNTQQRTATHCNNTPPPSAKASRSLRQMAHITGNLCLLYRNTLQHSATHCNKLQHAATHCHTHTHCNTLQRTTTHRTSVHVLLPGHPAARLVPLAGLFAGLTRAGLSPAKCPAKSPTQKKIAPRKSKLGTPRLLPARFGALYPAVSCRV